MNTFAVYHLDGTDYCAENEEIEAVNQSGKDLLASLGYPIESTDDVFVYPTQGTIIVIEVNLSADSLKRERIHSFVCSIGFLASQREVSSIVERIKSLPLWVPSVS